MRRPRASLLAVLMIGAGVSQGAQVLVGDDVVPIDVPLSWFEDDDRVLAGPAGAVKTVRDLLELRTQHEHVEAARLIIERRGKRVALELPAAQHWGLHPPVPISKYSPRMRVPDPASSALAAEERGLAALLQWDGAGAENAWREAHASRVRIDPVGIAALKAQLGLAEALLLRRNLAAADAQFLAVETSLRTSWPLAPLRYRPLAGRAAIAIEQRDVPGAEALLAAADALAQSIPQPALSEIEVQRLWGRVRYLRDDLTGAGQRYERAQLLVRQWLPGSAAEALIESNIGVIEWRQGDLAGAERRYARALEAATREAPGSVLVAGLLMNLGTVHHLRRDHAAAERNYRRAVDIFAAASATSRETLRALTNLAMAQGLGGKPGEANASLDRVLAAQLEREPRSSDVAYTYTALGLNYSRLEDWPRADASYSQATAIYEALGMLGMNLANTLTSRANMRMSLRQGEAARADLNRALAIYDRLATASHARAECLHALGLLARQQGDVALAMDLFRRAIAVLEAQQSLLGGSDEVRSSYSAYYSSYYKDYVELLLRGGSAPEAFETLERYRGRVLRAALAGVGRVVSSKIPADLRDERDQLHAAIEKAQTRLQAIEKPLDEAQSVTALLKQIEALRAREDVVAASIRERVPRVAEMDEAQVMGVAQVRAVLPRDAALLSFAVLPESVEIFVVTPGGNSNGLVWKSVAVSAPVLRERIDRLAFLLSTPGGASDSQQALERGLREMYESLIAPVAAQLARYPNWIVVPDGPLHRLPFAALREPDSGGRYVVESRALTTVVSATVFARLQKRAVGRAFRPGVAAFGDPQLAAGAKYATSTARGDALRDELSRPLPWARMEVEEIGRLIGTSAEVYVGSAATEAKVREVAPQAPALHFAAHGVVDEQSPLDSFLLLAGPVAGGGPTDDGRLSAREVFDLPPLSAALVTLSSCSTSASADNDGEGLIGLTRAFQANGANAVVSSLWKVSDRSTADLMLEFYRQWPAVSPDVALARAQRTLVGRHPFYWAAFEVSGARR
jgi:CHAT domain-containing protein